MVSAWPKLAPLPVRTIQRVRKASRIPWSTNDLVDNNGHIPALCFNFDITISKLAVSAPHALRGLFKPNRRPDHISAWLSIRKNTFIEAWQAGFLNVLCADFFSPSMLLCVTVHSICRWSYPGLCSGFPSCLCVCLCHSTEAGRAWLLELIKCVCWIPGTHLLTSFTSFKTRGAQSQWPWSLRSF